MKKILLVGVVSVIIVALLTELIIYKKSNIQGPKLYISEDSWNFGPVKTGSALKHSIILKNTGNSELTFYPYPSCPACMYIELDKYSISPKSEMILTIRITEIQEGPYEGYVKIESNDPTQPIKKLIIRGELIR